MLLSTTALTLVPAMAARAATEAERPREPAGSPPRPSGIDLRLAQGEPARRYDIPAGPLATALNRFADESGLQLVYDAEIARGVRTSGVSGTYTAEEVLSLLLAGTGLEYRMTGAATVTLGRAPGEEGGRLRLGMITLRGETGHAGEYEVDDGFKAEYQTSATKTPLPIRETPQSISVVTRDELKARQVQDLGQALETAAGVNQYSGPGPFGGKSPFGFDEVQIRGVALDGALDIREDGFVNPTFFSQPDLALYERVEAVKGPSSVLYGRGSAGGFINRVRKKPLPEAELNLKAETGSFDHYRGEADVTGPLFSSDKVRGRLIAAYQDAGSFVDGVEAERGLLAPSLEFDSTEGTRVLLQGSYQRDEFIPNPGFPLQVDGSKFRAPNIDRSLFVGVPSANESVWQAWTGTGQVEQQLGEKWLATLRLTRTRQDSPVDVDNYAYGIAANGDVGLYSSEFQFDTDAWAGEFKLDGSVDAFGTTSNVTVGLDHFDFEQERTDAFAALGTANIYDANFADFPTQEPVLGRHSILGSTSTGVYGQLVLRPIERLRVLLGARYDWADSSYVDVLADTTSQKKDNAFTGRVGLSYDVLQNVSVYGLYAQSFSPDVFAVARGGEILDPETGVIYEAGVKTDWFDGRLGVNASVFRIERENVPITDPNNGPGEFFQISGGRQRSDGIELEVNGEPLPGWRLSFAGTLLDAAFVEQDDPFFGTRPAGTADWQVGLFTSYELQEGMFQGLGVGAGLFAIGERGISSFQAGGVVDGYERVDLSAFYNGYEPFRIGLQVRNIFDERYVEGVDRTGAYAQFGSPRAVLLSVRAQW